MKILLDTNVLAMPAQFKVDIFEQALDLEPDGEFATLNLVVNELKMLKDRQAAAVAMKLVEDRKIEIINETGKTDEALLRQSAKTEAILFTNDKELRKTANERGISTMFMRQKKIVVMEEA
ncbi:MAG: ribonuclease VapC [Candidatus Micrarchaeota archaeon]